MTYRSRECHEYLITHDIHCSPCHRLGSILLVPPGVFALYYRELRCCFSRLDTARPVDAALGPIAAGQADPDGKRQAHSPDRLRAVETGILVCMARHRPFLYSPCVSARIGRAACADTSKFQGCDR
jgi:hypothetical protein